MPDATLLLAFDPGLPDAGAALYRSTVLVRAAWVRVPAPAAGASGRVDALVALLDALEREMGLQDAGPMPAVVLAEWPQILRPERAKAKFGRYIDQQPLLELAGTSAALLDRAASWGARCERYTPDVWKGTVKKAQHQRNGLAMLSPEEREHLPRGPKTRRYLSDPLDAALLGLWYLQEKTRARQPRYYNRPAEFVGLVEET